jgi:O-antigen/teichoic acid export membrane protein
MLWPSLVAGIGMLGIGDAIIYRAAREGHGPSAVLSNSLLLAVPQSLLLSAVAWVVILIALHGKGSVASEAEFYLWFIPLNLLTSYPVAFLQGRMAMRSFNALRASVHISYTASLALLWATHNVGVHQALAASLLANGITLGLCADALRRARSFAPRLNANELRSLITLGLKLQLGNIAFLLASRIDIVLLSFLVPAAALGNYVVAASVGALPLLVPSAASYVLYPLFSRQPKAQAQRAFARFMFFAILMTVLAAPAVVLVSPLILRVFFGGAFESAVAIAQILGLVSVVRGLSVMFGAVLRGLGSPVRASGGDIAGLAVMAVFLVPAIRVAQGEGAAVAVLLGAAIAVAWMIYQAMHVVGLSAVDLFRWWRAELGGNLPASERSK